MVSTARQSTGGAWVRSGLLRSGKQRYGRLRNGRLWKAWLGWAELRGGWPWNGLVRSARA